MKLWVTLEGRDEEVEFHTEGGRLWLEVDGRRLEADFRRLPDGEVYSLLVDGRSYEVRVVHIGSGIEVTRHGSTVAVEVRHPLEKFVQSTRSAAANTEGETVTAPMPGLVVAFRVAPGELVAPGQSVAVVEAMKMQNELSARHGGIVSAVLVRERDAVSAGQPLIRIRPA